MSKFEFDYDAIKGLTYEEGFKALFQQMEDHYNTEVNVKPDFVFGGLPPKQAVQPVSRTIKLVDATIPTDDKKFIRVAPDWEVKDATTMGLKEGNVLTGVSVDGVEIFDYVKNYKPGDVIADGESAKYDLSAK